MTDRLSAVARRTLHITAILACAAGLGVWGAILLAPQPGRTPPALVADDFRPQNIEPVAAWFGAGPALRVQVASSGLIAAGPDSAAILSIDGGTPRAYRVGQQLASDLVLSEVRPDAIVITQGGQASELAVPALPPISGISVAR